MVTILRNVFNHANDQQKEASGIDAPTKDKIYELFMHGTRKPRNIKYALRRLIENGGQFTEPDRQQVCFT